MKKYPSQYADLFSEKGKRFMRMKMPIPNPNFTQRRHGTMPFIKIPGMLDLATSNAIHNLMERSVSSVISRSEVLDPIPYLTSREEQTYMNCERRHYTYVDDESKGAMKKLLGEIGLYDCLKSDSFLDFCYRATGLELETDQNTNGAQANRYEPGDYMQQHTDYFNRSGNKVEASLPRMCLNVNINCPKNVLDHLVLCQGGTGHFDYLDNTCADPTAITIYNLPFFHQVLPMRPARKGAVRWLIMGEAYLTDKQVDGLVENYPDHWQVEQMTSHLRKGQITKLLRESKKAYIVK